MEIEDAGNYTMEASELGFKPGEWPESFVSGDVCWARGREEKSGSHFIGYNYTGDNGEQLVVFND